MKLLRYFLPFLLFIVVMVFLYQGLHRDPHELPSALIGQPVKPFSYPSLLHSQPVTEKQFLGQVTLLHVWASWCTTCRAEHHVLMDIANSHKVVIYGLNYKDDPAAAKQWLEQYGNPYQAIIADTTGTLAIDFGVYGTPETFIIDSKGIVRYKYIGVISPDVWQDKIQPELEKWRKK